MSLGKGIIQGRFGRAALLDIDGPLAPHAHPHCHVLIKIAGADSHFRVGSQSYPLTDDSAVAVNAWQPHGYPHGGPAARSTILALYVEPTWLGEIERSFARSAEPDFFARSCFTLRAARRPSLAKVGDYRIRRALDMLDRHIGQPEPLAHIARSAGLSRSHVFALFKERTQLTPAMYLAALRMEEAYGALPNATLSMAQIATRLGFSAQGHFSRFFRNTLGITPREYRRVMHLLPERAPSGGARA